MDLTDRQQRIAAAILRALRDRGAPAADAVLHTEVDIRCQTRGHPTLDLADWLTVRQAIEAAGLIVGERSRLGGMRWRLTADGMQAADEA